MSTPYAGPVKAELVGGFYDGEVLDLPTPYASVTHEGTCYERDDSSINWQGGLANLKYRYKPVAVL